MSSVISSNSGIKRPFQETRIKLFSMSVYSGMEFMVWFLLFVKKEMKFTEEKQKKR